MSPFGRKPPSKRQKNVENPVEYRGKLTNFNITVDIFV